MIFSVNSFRFASSLISVASMKVAIAHAPQYSAFLHSNPT